MYQFFTGSDDDFQQLERRARGTCLCFNDQAMPVGATPDKARVGFEVAANGESARLLVDRGISFAGGSPQVRDWLASGMRTFRSFPELRDWLRGELAAAYVRHESTVASRGAVTSSRSSSNRQADRGQPGTGIKLDPNELFERVRSEVRGQDSAIRELTARACRHLARTNPRRPATLLLVGPTGVGKTGAAESLAVNLTELDPEQRYSHLRLDMSEYQEAHRVSQLLGAPQGYIGYGDGAQLVDALSENPRTVGLFDEIEKAHPNILRTLMNAMDAGRLSTSSSRGESREIDCRSAIFVFTTNLDAAGILAELTATDSFEDSAAVAATCRDRLRAQRVPSEILSRISTFLIFRPLSAEVSVEIAALSIARVAAEYGLDVRSVDRSVVDLILEKSESRQFGARVFEYLADEMLGSCFAGTDIVAPLHIHGGDRPRCIPDGEVDASIDRLQIPQPSERPIHCV